MKKRPIIFFILISVFLIILIWINLVSGSVFVPFSDIMDILSGNGGKEMDENIIMNIRLPRAEAAMLLGGALALSGYLLQTFFNNPIAGPFVLGISSGAKLFVSISMILFMSKGLSVTSLSMVFSAFLGAMIAMGFVLLISLKVKNMSILIVCGILIGYICSSITDLIVTFADDQNIVNLHNWSMGSLSGINRGDIRIIFILVLICFIVSVVMSKPMGTYRLGESYALSMGVNIKLLRIAMILLSSFLAACVTAFAGPISFVGIAVPHLARLSLKTSKPHIMIPACFLSGAVVTLFCDCIARTVFAPTELSVSSVTAFFLAPVVIVMMVKRKRQ